MKDLPYTRLNALQRTVWDVYNWLVPLVAINLIWTGLSMTLILLPAATLALYDIAYLAHRGHGPEIKQYLAAIRQRLLAGSLWGVALLGFGIVATVAVFFYRSQGNSLSQIPLVLIYLFSIFIIATQFYLLPYKVIQGKGSWRHSWKNAAFTVLADPLLILVNGGVALVLIVLGVLLIFPMVFIVPVSVAFLGTYSLLDWLDYRGLLPKQELME